MSDFWPLDRAFFYIKGLKKYEYMNRDFQAENTEGFYLSIAM